MFRIMGAGFKGDESMNRTVNLLSPYGVIDITMLLLKSVQ